MLDVHPPHEATHTWTDFFIHIATIVVGLVIAIGLEQGVEAIHHRHERQQFEDDMRAESQENLRIIDNDIAKDLPDLRWMIHAVGVLQSATPQNGVISVTLPKLATPEVYGYTHTAISTVPLHGVWTMAQATGVVNLLSKEQAQVYTRLDFEAAEFLRIDGINDVQITECQSELRSLNVPFQPEATLRLTPAQRDALVRAVEKRAQLQSWDDTRLLIWKGALEATLNRVPTVNAMFPYVGKYNSLVPQP